MAIIDNRSTEEGDILIIKPEVPILGLISLSQFVDTTVAESETDYFRKEFRYSENGGLTFSDWVELSLINIEGLTISKFSQFVIEYRYTRVGDAPEVELEFDDILVSGEVESLPYPVFDNSLFYKFFNVNDINVFGWALNVLEKLYSKGTILPDYYERGENKSNLDDEDFIVFWNTITHFFAIIVYYARQFHNFQSNEILLEEFLKSKDLTLPYDNNIEDILYLYQNYVDEYKKRGSISILDQKELGSDIDGEFIRLINHSINEELIFAVLRNYETGWCLGKSSPTYKGTCEVLSLQKAYEFTKEVADLTVYPLINGTFITKEDGKIKITGVTAGVTAGISYDSDSDKLIKINSNVDYEIGFRISQSSGLDNLSFGCRVWDENMNELSFKSMYNGSNTNYFFSGQSLKLSDQEYLVRGVLFNQDKSLDVNSKTNIGIGVNLKFPSSAVFICPIITVIGGTTQVTLIDSVVVRPTSFNFSRGQLGRRPIIYNLTLNNNDNYFDGQINKIVSKKLIPANSFLKSNWI